MAEKRAQRRLAAIMAADVVGYSRLMEHDETGTLTALKARRRDVLVPVVAQHNGRVVNFMGDGVLVEFGSAVDAVQCAVELQKGFAGANEGVPETNRIVLRIGINLGDVIVEGSDLYGDGVNVAARLEGLAEPGGIYASASVQEQVSGKLSLAFDDLGEHSLKNIAKPVRVFAVHGGTAHYVAAPIAQPGMVNPSIAVLPFTNMSGDAEQDYLSDGITEDVITELSRFRNLLVIARNSSFAFKGQSLDLREVGRKLGASYVVEGSVRRAGKRIRITAQLIDARSGAHIWADRYDRDLVDVFEVQDELVRTIVSTIGGRIEVAAKAQATRLSDQGLRAYDLYLRAVAAEDKNTREAYRNAGDLLQRSIAQDAGFAPAHHHLSLVTLIEWMAFWVEDRDKAFADALSAARAALALDDSNSSLHAHFGMLLMYSSDYDESALHFAKAFELNPNDAKAKALHGLFLTAIGQPHEAIGSFDLAARLNPLHPDWSNWLKGIAYFTARRYTDAILTFKAINKPMNEVRGWLAASYAFAGNHEQAVVMLEAFLRIARAEMPAFPEPKIAAWAPFWHGAIPYKNDTDREHLFAGLRKAGMLD